MTTWTDGAAPALNGTNLNTLQALASNAVPNWLPNTAYGAGVFVLNPTGDLVKCTTAHTSGSSYSMTNWAYSATFVQTSSKGAANGVAGLDATGLVPVAQLPTSTADYGYLYVGFTGNGVFFEKMNALTSADGHTFTGSEVNPIYTDPGTGTSFRDPSVLKIGSTWFCAYTVNNGNSKNFGLVKSTDLLNWTSLSGTANTPTLVDVSAVSGLSQCWAPELVVDNSGNVYAFWTDVPTSGAWKLYYTQFTDSTGLTTWNAPAAVSWATAPTDNVWDATMAWDSGASLWRIFYAFGSSSTNWALQRAYASTPTGTWTTDKTGDWASWMANSAANTYFEAPELTKSGSTWRIYLDPWVGTNPATATHPGYVYSESADLNTWLAPKACPVGPGYPSGQVMRHGSFTHLTTQADRNLVDGVASERSPIRHAEYTGTFATTANTATGPGTLTLDSGTNFKASDFVTTPAASQITIGVAGIYTIDFECMFNSTACSGGFVAIKNSGATSIFATQDLVSTAQAWNVSAPNLYCSAGQILQFYVQTGVSIAGCTARVRITKIA